MFNHQIVFDTPPLVTPIQSGEVVGLALQTMEDEGWDMLPVVSDEGFFKGFVFENDLLDADASSEVTRFLNDANPMSVLSSNHFFSAAKLMVQHSLPFVVVVDADNHYQGSITARQILQQYYQITDTQSNGALLVLRVAPEDYAISQLARLVESNDAIITQINTQLEPETGMMLVTLRLNKTELSAIISTLQRYDYTIVFFEGIEAYENELVRNYNHLISYLDM